MDFSFPLALISVGPGLTAWPCFLGALSVLLLLSGIDDFIPLMIVVFDFCRRHCMRGRQKTGENLLEIPYVPQLERRIAIFVPCWKESAVIGNMVRHNLAAIRYRNFDFFLGVYPNDEDTVRVAEQLATEFHNVHVACGPRPGPTSKADCLNGVYARMQVLEQERGIFFDTVVLHDAEDLIHPQALEVINTKRTRYEMVQVPVLPLATDLSDVTHGIYCDEFAEYQMIDMRAREMSKSFVPSNGVGTGFARDVLEQLAAEHDGLVFDAGSLTEDYEIGVRIHKLGHRQCFVPLARTDKDFVATREYFPNTLHTAVRQRTRWITGIALQCWERQGWRGSWRIRYWFWRDRKGLLTNPLSVVANILFLAGIADYIVSITCHTHWAFEIQNRTVAVLCVMTTVLQSLRIAVRSFCVARIFGLPAGITVPLRSFYANAINCAAGIKAVHGYLIARRNKKTLAWQKTEHHYPGRDALNVHRRELGDVLLGCGYLSQDQLQQAQALLAEGSTLDTLLLAKGLINEEQLCKARSLQSGFASARVDPTAVTEQNMRGLPTYVERQYGAVAFGVRSGKLLVATSDVPSTATLEEVTKLAELPVEFQLVTPSVYQRLRTRALEPCR